MDYPRYRQHGLPTTSCLVESQIKEVNHRVKGTEKFWNDGQQVEAMLQIVTAILSDEDHLTEHFQRQMVHRTKDASQQMCSVKINRPCTPIFGFRKAYR